MARPSERKRPTWGERLVENGPMLTMWALGAIILSYFGWLASMIYIVFCIFSIIWFIRFICTYCVNSRTGYCESGLGNIGHSLFAPRPPRFFGRQFKRNIAIQFPIWFIPPIVAIYALIKQFSYAMLLLLIIFCIIAFVILPYESTKKVCDDCPMRYSCPWTNAKKNKKSKPVLENSEE
jgi:hypothetical protein